MNAAIALWAWAVQAYARPGVEPLCLELQDRDGQSVPFLLWAAWLGPTSDEILHRAAGLTIRWEGQVVGPLRTARRALKDLDCEPLRQQVKALELEAERGLLSRLEALAPRGDDPSQLRTALLAASKCWKSRAPVARLKHLATLLG